MALTTINSGGVKDDSIVNADIKSDAAIAGSKINPTFTTAASITAAQPQLQFQDSDGTNQITEVSNSSGHTYIKTRNNTGGGNFYVNTWDNTNSNYPTLFTILNGGNVGIGTTSPSTPLHVKNAGSTACRFILENTGSGSDDSTQIWSQNNDLAFNTNDSERMRIKSTGIISINDSTPETFATLQVKNHTTHDHASLLLHGADLAQILLRDETGGTNEKVTTIRNDEGDFLVGTHNDAYSNWQENIRIKHAGGITFNGDTAAANALDDYEEGTWTPTFNESASWTTSNCSYVKIGRVVKLTALLQSPTNTTSSTIMRVTGLPFSVAHGQACGTMMGYDVNADTHCAYINGSHQLFFYGTNGSAAWTYLQWNGLASGSTIYFDATYIAAS